MTRVFVKKSRTKCLLQKGMDKNLQKKAEDKKIPSTKGDLVLPEEVKEIFDSADEPKNFLVLENIGHDYRLNDDEVALVNMRTMEQLAEYL